MQVNTELPMGSTRDGFGSGLVEAAEKYDHIVGLCADLTESTRMNWFAEKFPNRFFQVGVAEQNLAGVAAGLALAGKKPFAASYATFHPGNSWGVIRSSICYQDVPVVLVGGHSGIAIGPDGATHQGLEDIALMRVLPNMTVVVPCDHEEARKAAWVLAELDSPSYLRTTKHAVRTLTYPATPFEIGKAVSLYEGSDVTIIACGVAVEQAIQTAYDLAHDNISVRVLNMHTIKPIDVDAIIAAAHETKHIITVEDHQVHGGLGSAVAEVLAQHDTPPELKFKIMGVEDTFGESGNGVELLNKYKLSAYHIEKQVREFLAE